MKLFALLIFRHHHPSGAAPYLVASAFDLSSFGYFQKGPAREFITFLSRTVAQRTDPGTRVQVEKDQYVLYVHSQPSGLVACVAVDAAYPARVAFGLCAEAMSAFVADAGTAWAAADAPAVDVRDREGWRGAEALLQKYADPAEADKVLAIRRDLEEVRTTMHLAISQVLQRGEQLDQLVERSGDLSASSQMFYKQTKKANACCSLGA